MQERGCALSLSTNWWLILRILFLAVFFFFFIKSLVSVLLQGDAGGADRTKKPESTSSYNYRVVKEVRVQGGSY